MTRYSCSKSLETYCFMLTLSWPCLLPRLMNETPILTFSVCANFYFLITNLLYIRISLFAIFLVWNGLASHIRMCHPPLLFFKCHCHSSYLILSKISAFFLETYYLLLCIIFFLALITISTSCRKQPLKWSPVFPASWYSCSCVNSFP